MEEIWKDVKGYEGIYAISSYGRCKSLQAKLGYGRMEDKDGIMKIENIKHHNGYCTIKLTVNKIKKTARIHRLVAEAFIPNPNNYPFINHIDGNKLNNNVENLEWCNHQQNMEHASKHKLINQGIKRKIKQLTLDNVEIKIFNSIREASKETNVNRDSISLCLKGIQHKAGNYKWEYVD